MPRQHRSIECLIPGKIRKRGCSSSASSSSSILQNYRFKRAILLNKRAGSSTPFPSWRIVSSRSPASALRTMESPKYPQSQNGGKMKHHTPLSARKLAATLWEMNEIPSPSVKENSDKRRLKKEGSGRERVARSTHSGSWPSHLSDPSHSPVLERLDQSGTGTSQRRAASISQMLRLADHNVGALDSISNGSIMEVETRSRAQTPSGSTVGVKARLKDISNALTTSKELLRIINRIWGHEDRPSSTTSLISALHAELERARLQVNQVIHEKRSDQDEINFLMKCFAEEKAAWKSKEQEVIEAAIESVAGELEVERKLRRRFESLNKKIGRELAETKVSLLKAVKELDTEKKARENVEQVCDELVRDVGDAKAEVEHTGRRSAKLREEVEKEREMMQLADVLLEERVQQKLSEAKYQPEEENAAIDKLRNQLEAFLGTKRAEERHGSLDYPNDEQIAAYLGRTRFGSHQNEGNENGDIEDAVECEEESAESDLHSIELNMDNNNKSYRWANSSIVGAHDPRKVPFNDEDVVGRKSTSGKVVPRKSTSLQRIVSDAVKCGIQTECNQNSGNGFDWGGFSELEKQAQGKDYGDNLHGYKAVRGLKDQILSGYKIRYGKYYASPTRQQGQSWPSRDAGNTAQDRPAMVPGNGSKLRVAETRGDCQNARKSK